MKGATLSGEFVEIVLQKSFTSKKCLCKIYNYVRIRTCRCVHVYMYGSEVSPLYYNHSRQRGLSCYHD